MSFVNQGDIRPYILPEQLYNNFIKFVENLFFFFFPFFYLCSRCPLVRQTGSWIFSISVYFSASDESGKLTTHLCSGNRNWDELKERRKQFFTTGLTKLCAHKTSKTKFWFIRKPFSISIIISSGVVSKHAAMTIRNSTNYIKEIFQTLSYPNISQNRLCCSY